MDLKQRLAAAAGEGIITPEQAARLSVYLAVTQPALAAPAPFDPSLCAPRDEGTVPAAEETEMPRFVRGFHDVLITLGIIITLSGLLGLAHPVVGLLACIMLSEVLVLRQRLALPAVVLTLAFIASATFVLNHLQPLVFNMPVSGPGIGQPLFYLAGYAALTVPYYLRYRVPLALSGMIVVLAACLTLLASAVVSNTLYGSADPVAHPLVLAGCGLVAAIGVFLVALRFDLADPARVTRRSDVAFWLHLVTAPALLYSILGLIFYSRHAELGWNIGTLTAEQPGSVMGIVALFILLGVLIDRRAFVTSGLLSLGFSIWQFVQSNSIASDSRFYVVLVLLGTFVLLIGGLWMALRRLVIGALPSGLQRRLPVVR